MEKVSRYGLLYDQQKCKNFIFTIVNISKSNHRSVFHAKELTFGEVENKMHFQPMKASPGEMDTH